MSPNAGNQRGIEALYERDRAHVFAVCFAILRDAADAEDAVQETFARVTPRLGALQGDPSGYLVAVARNVCRDEVRRQRRSLTVEAPLAHAAAQATEDTAVELHLLGTAWDGLAHSDRTLLAYSFSGLSLAEIGRRVGVGVDVVAQRVSRARRRARRLVSAPAALLLPVAASAADRLAQRVAMLHARQALGMGRLRTVERLGAPLLIGLLAGGLAGSAPPLPTPPRSAPVAEAPLALAPPGGTMQAVGAGKLPAGGTVLLRPPVAPGPALPLPAVQVPPALSEMKVDAFTSAPHAGNTVFATGTCVVPGCGSSLARSDDGGRTWHDLGGAGLSPYSRLLLPPDFPADATLFATASGGPLLRSDDGGASFTAVTPAMRGDAAVDPASPPGDPRIFLVSATGPLLLTYTDSTRKLALDSTMPLDIEAITALFTGPGAHHVYVSATEAVGGGGLFACGGGAPCQRVGPGVSGIPSVSPTFGSDLAYFTLATTGVQVMRIDGGDAHRVDTGAGVTAVAILPDADYAATRRLDVVVQRVAGPVTLLAMLRYQLMRDGPPTETASGWTVAMDFNTVLRLADGTVLAGRSGGGLACSHDDGASFAPAC